MLNELKDVLGAVPLLATCGESCSAVEALGVPNLSMLPRAAFNELLASALMTLSPSLVTPDPRGLPGGMSSPTLGLPSLPGSIWNSPVKKIHSFASNWLG